MLTKKHYIRFHSKYIRIPNGCWIWVRSKNGKGYGTMTVNSKSYLAHRFSFLLRNGYLPKWPRVLSHTCHDKSCVNPAHLQDDSQSGNMQLSYE